MTTDEISIATLLNSCSLLPGSFNKRFIKSIYYQAINKPESELTEKQKEWLFRLLYTYRGQVPETYKKYSDNPFCRKINR